MKKSNLVNFSNSFLAHFGVKPFHNTIKEVDEALKGHQKVAIILFDGMGQNIIKKHLRSNSFIRKNYLCTINSTFPPTTVSATTAFLTGLHPIETGWLAWAQYFEKYNRNIILFKNEDYNTEEHILPLNIANDYLPIKTILEIVKENDGDVDTFDIKKYPISANGPKSLKDMQKIINKTLKNTNKCLAYFYYDGPDFEMHMNGIDHPLVHQSIKEINQLVNHVVKKNPDTIFFTFADHGHINVKYLDMCEHDDLYQLLAHSISLEKRTPTFFVKEGKNEQFETLFKKYYGEHFTLMSKDEVLKLKLFGEGKINPKAIDFIGDFVATSNDEYCLYASKEMSEIDFLKGHHAGNTIEELLIDVSAYNV